VLIEKVSGRWNRIAYSLPFSGNKKKKIHPINAPFFAQKTSPLLTSQAKNHLQITLFQIGKKEGFTKVNPSKNASHS
jgi:hypothetical protein